MRRWSTLLVILAVPGVLTAQDRAWWDTLPAPRREAVSFTRQSLLVTMRDGVRLAVDLYLPGGAGADRPVATMLHQTRYRRGLQFRDPAREAAAGPSFGLMPFLQAGYAVVIVDVRGTGASFGWRPVEFSPDEVGDGWDVLDWIVAQPWSDGSVGATGISYPGTTAELVGTLGHPALKAVAPLFSIYDFYADVIRPGGIFLDPFFRAWANLVSRMDANSFDPPGGPVTGVRPVDGPDGARLLAEAIADHSRNASIHPQAAAMVTRDDRGPDGISLEAVSPHALYDTLSRRIPIYSYGGWADGFSGSQIKRFLDQPSPGSRLIMGPWNHGGGWAYYPGRAPARSQFNQAGELLRFFDHHVRGMATGIEHEPPVWYFTTGSDEWRSAERWPVATDRHRLHLQGDGRLTTDSISPPPARHAPVLATFTTNRDPGTGNQSRWNTILGGGAVRYPTRKAPDLHGDGWTAFESVVLGQDVTVTGHPVLTLISTHSDTTPTLFVYLEEVDSLGNGHLVTEGQLALVHRAVAPAPDWYPVPEAYHSFRSADRRALTDWTGSGLTATSTIELLPVSHRFSKGSRIRLVVAGSDRDHFELPVRGDDVTIGSWGSVLELPVE